MEASSCVLGIDLGTSALKLVALAHDGPGARERTRVLPHDLEIGGPGGTGL